jgi:hypothetical protein
LATAGVSRMRGEAPGGPPQHVPFFSAQSEARL